MGGWAGAPFGPVTQALVTAFAPRLPGIWQGVCTTAAYMPSKISLDALMGHVTCLVRYYMSRDLSCATLVRYYMSRDLSCATLVRYYMSRDLSRATLVRHYMSRDLSRATCAVLQLSYMAG